MPCLSTRADLYCNNVRLTKHKFMRYEALFFDDMNQIQLGETILTKFAELNFAKSMLSLSDLCVKNEH